MILESYHRRLVEQRYMYVALESLPAGMIKSIDAVTVNMGVTIRGGIT